MEALKKKWNSSRGASILLALLFMFICIMAGASVLMAAASNVGKINSNREEQQKYLTLSSALQLLVDELESVEYVGKFSYNLSSPRPPAVSPTPVPGINDYLEVDETYTQTQGSFVQRVTTNPITNAQNDLKDILPLFDNMDYFFAEQIIKKHPADVTSSPVESAGPSGSITSTTTITKYISKADLYAENLVPQISSRDDALAVYKKISLDAKYDLDFTVGDGSDNYGFATKVNVTVSVNREGTISLIASLGDDEKLKMKATLKLITTTSKDDLDAIPYGATTPASGSEYETDVYLKWELDKIEKVW